MCINTAFRNSFKTVCYLGLISLFVALIACNRINKKANAIAEKTTNKKDALVDKVFPRFDAYQPDTKYNKWRFKEFLKVEITPDVKNIFCYGDAIGIDAKYQFAFNCSKETATRIIEKHSLKPDTSTTDPGYNLQTPFEWWPISKIKTLKFYSFVGEHSYYKYFWYDPKEQKAYYFDFDM
jgi:hypothetical protein